jgi:UDP-N-acetylmuramate dehydrogenase
MQTISSVSLKTLSAIRVGGTAERVLYPETVDELIQAKQTYPNAPVIGGGTNIFFNDRLFEVIIATKKLTKTTRQPDGTITAECGVPLAELFDFAAGIPATVGGGIMMNFGAYNKEIKDYVTAVTILDGPTPKTIPAKDLRWGYRSSSLKEKRQLVLFVTFSRTDTTKAEANLAQRKKVMPWGKPNIGSIFKNPPEHSAGALLEQCGLKGRSIGGIQVSSQHANIFVNTGNGTYTDVVRLIELAQTTVQDKQGIHLEPEVIAIP